MSDLRRAACLLVCLMGICSIASAEESGSSFVDCDAGGDLGAALAAADHYGAQLGMQIEGHSTGTLFFSTVRNNVFAGVVVIEHSGRVVTTSEIFGNGSIGLNADRVSVIEVDNSRLSDHVEAHAIARDRSRLQLRTNTIIGVRDDPAQFAVGVDELSELQINDKVTVHGDIHGSNSSLMRVATSQVHGSVFISGFSNFRLFRGEVDGGIECRKGADAYCDFGATATTDGCMSAKPVRHPGPFVSREPTTDRIDQLRKLFYEIAPRTEALPEPGTAPKK